MGWRLKHLFANSGGDHGTLMRPAMSSRGDLDHVADWARAAATEAEHDKVVRAFNEALRVIALCQRKLKVRQVISILSARGGVNVALLGDAGGGRNARYATV